MVATTATWAIPYAQSTDPFCDGNEITQSLAERVDELLDVLDLDITEVERPAFASISVTTPVLTESGFYTVYYDTIDEDTANLADLSLDSQVIQRPQGLWFMGANIGSTTDGGTASNVIMPGLDWRNDEERFQAFRENDGILQQSVSAIGSSLVGDFTDSVASYFLPNGGSVPLQFLVNVARMWAWRFSTLP
jgi:hypothetical protein